MKFWLPVLFTLGVSPAWGQAPSPAQMGITPTTPQVLEVLNAQQAWVPIGTVSSANGFSTLSREISLVSLGAKCDGSTDDTAAIQAWLNLAAPYVRLTAPAGQCKFTAPLATPSGQYDWTLEGGGRGATTFIYEGTATTGNLITFGSTVNGCSETNVVIRGLSLRSTVTMTANDGLNFSDLCNSTIEDFDAIGDHTINGNGDFYIGCHFNGGNRLWIRNYSCRGSYAGEVDNGDATIQSTDMFHYNMGLVKSGYGLLIAGWCGGCYWDSGDVVSNTNANVRIDQSIIPHSNPQVRFGPNFASDGGPPLGVDVEDIGTSALTAGSLPLATTATASFAKGATSIPVAACPSPITGGWYVFDRSLVPPAVLGTFTACTGNAVTLTNGGGAAFVSAGTADNLYLSGGPGPGRQGSQIFFEGSWVSTNPGTCLNIGANVSKEIHLMGARIENCSTAGVTNNSDQVRLYIAGGAIAQNGTGLVNNAKGAHIELQARPSAYGNVSGVYGGTATLTPSIVTGCGGSGSSVFGGDDYGFRVSWGSTAGTTCQIAFSFNHDNSPQNIQVSAVGVNNYGWAVTPIVSNGLTFNFNASMASGNQFSVAPSGYSF